MKQNVRRATPAALLAGALLTVISCSSSEPLPPPGESSSAAAVQPGVPGGVFVETHKVTARVTKVDADTRVVTLLASDGKSTPVTCGPDVINFDQIHVGDQVKMTVAEELAVYMSSAAAPGGTAGVTAVKLAPKGGRPGGVMVNAVQTTAVVTAIGLKNHKATLQFPDGSTRTITVRPDVDLTKRSVGERVTMRATQALAISVEQP
jgi:hypothetical protein